MTGYFDALIRSTGMPVGRPAPVVADTGIGVAGIEVEHETTARASRATDTLTLQQTAASIPSRIAVQRPIATEVALPLAQSPREGQAAPAPGITNLRTADPGKADLGQAMVRAALQWVAADAQHDRIATPRVSPSRVHDEGDESMAAVQPFRHHHPARPLQPISPSPVAATTHAVTHQPVTTQPPPVRASLITDTTATSIAAAPVDQPVRDEVVEISIGAIHVRVDAPAAQTVTRLSPPAATSRPSPPRVPRSALSRRALRKI